MAQLNTFSNLEDYQNSLGTNPVSTQDFENFDEGTDLKGVEFISGISATSNSPRLEVFQGSGDKNLFILDRQSLNNDAFYEINFSESYNAVGFDIEAFDPNTSGPAILDISFADGDSTSVEIFPTNATESDPIFFGVVADQAISQIRLTEGPEVSGVGNEEISLDNFIVANIPPTQEITSSYEINSPNTVPFELFNVLVPGTIEVDVTSEGESSGELTVTLNGSRRPELDDPTAPYAQVSGSPPLTLTYEVTEEDIARGVSWRVEVDSGDNVGFQGDIEITIPTASDQQVQDFEQQKISLRSGDLLPRENLQEEFLEELNETSSEGLHGIISFTRTPLASELQQLEEAGIFRQSILSNNNVYGLVGKGVNLSDPNIDELIEFITPLEPEDKIAPDILVGNYAGYVVTPSDGTPQNYVLNPDGTLSLSVVFARDVPLAEVNLILTTYATTISPLSDQAWLITLPESNLLPLATHDEVEWIDAGSGPQLLRNDTLRATIGVDTVQNATVNMSTGTITYNGLSGAGVTVGIEDTGIDAAHADFATNLAVDIPAVGSHGTHVAGIVAANGSQSNRNDALGNFNGGTLFQWRGVAPLAQLIDSNNLTTTARILAATSNNSLDVSNHSAYSLGPLDGAYPSQLQVVDQMIRGGALSGETKVPRRPQVYAAGNNGTAPQYSNQFDYFSIDNQLKNAINVGNWNAISNQLSPGSSLGPAHDGRIKPDLVAPGTSISSTSTNVNEQQRIDFITNTSTGNVVAFPSTGSFTLTFGGNTTAAIPFNASAATVQSSLVALTNIASGDVNVTGGPLPVSPININFMGNLGNRNVAPLISEDTGLDSGITSRVSTTTAGLTTNGYTSETGTSMASPAVAGVHALLLEGWQNTYSTPLGTTIDERPPLPSTLRALLIQTAEDIVMLNEDADNDGVLDSGEDLDGDGVLDFGVRGNTVTSNDVDADSDNSNGTQPGFITATVGPDYATGWGLVNAEAAVELMQDFREENGVPIPNRIIEDAVTQTGTVEYDFFVDQDFIDSGDLFKITLAWDDFESAIQNPAINPTLVNDLDLELIAPDGTIFYPWQLGHTILDASGNPLANDAQPPGTAIQINRSITPTTTPANSNDYIPANALTGTGDWVARRGKDHLNNVEQVLVDNDDLQIGLWEARIIGFNVPPVNIQVNIQDNTAQDYSLVTSTDTIDIIKSSVSYTLKENERNLALTGNNAIDGTGNNLDNLIIGNNANNILRGLGGNDTLQGLGGDDLLDGGTGNDSMSGQSGNDSYYIDNINDIITELTNEGNDTVFSSIAYTLGDNLENLTLIGNDAINGTGNSLNNTITGNDANNSLAGEKGDDKLIGGIGADILDGGEDNDTASYSTAKEGVTVSLTNTQDNTGDAQGDVFQSIENLEGSEFGDRLIGDVQNNDIRGLGGDDSLDGLTGDDTMSGGTGNDTYKVESVNDVVIEIIDQGIDTVDAAIDYILDANLENLNLLEGTAALNGTGNELNNIINGNSGDNVISGGDGDDSLIGGLGNESSVPGSLGKINGTPGSDILTGGNGNDAFIYNNIADTGDLITDFTVGDDKIVVTELMQSLGYAGSDPITDGFLGFKQASDSLAVLQIDPDGAASDMFNPMPFILLDNVSVAALNDSSNFVF